MTVARYHTSLQEYITSEWLEKGKHEGLGAVILAIADGSCQVQQHVRQAALADALGSTGEINVGGDIVQHLDTISSDIFVETLRQSGHVAAIGCEEIEKPVIIEGDVADGYIVLMDPLDGRAARSAAGRRCRGGFGWWCAGRRAGQAGSASSQG